MASRNLSSCVLMCARRLNEGWEVGVSRAQRPQTRAKLLDSSNVSSQADLFGTTLGSLARLWETYRSFLVKVESKGYQSAYTVLGSAFGAETRVSPLPVVMLHMYQLLHVHVKRNVTTEDGSLDRISGDVQRLRVGDPLGFLLCR